MEYPFSNKYSRSLSEVRKPAIATAAVNTSDIQFKVAFSVLLSLSLLSTNHNSSAVQCKLNYTMKLAGELTGEVSFIRQHHSDPRTRTKTKLIDIFVSTLRVKLTTSVTANLELSNLFALCFFRDVSAARKPCDEHFNLNFLTGRILANTFCLWTTDFSASLA